MFFFFFYKFIIKMYLKINLKNKTTEEWQELSKILNIE
jgi:hypothetical protein